MLYYAITIVRNPQHSIGTIIRNPLNSKGNSLGPYIRAWGFGVPLVAGPLG